MQEVSERHIEADYSNKGDIAAEGDYNKSIQSQLSRRIDNISADNEVSDSDGENEHKISKSLGTNSIDEHNDSKEKFNKSKGTTESFNPLNKVEGNMI